MISDSLPYFIHLCLFCSLSSSQIPKEGSPVKSRSYIFSLLIVTLALLSMSASTAEPALTFTFSNCVAHPKGVKVMEADCYAINDVGAITGDYIDSANVQHGMIIKGKNTITVDNKNCTSGFFPYIIFEGINSAEELAGYCINASGVGIGFTYAKGKFSPVSCRGIGATSTFPGAAQGASAGCAALGSKVA
jgi:hypothetical protein